LWIASPAGISRRSISSSRSRRPMPRASPARSAHPRSSRTTSTGRTAIAATASGSRDDSSDRDRASFERGYRPRDSPLPSSLRPPRRRRSPPRSRRPRADLHREKRAHRGARRPLDRFPLRRHSSGGFVKISLPKRPRRCVMTAFIGGPCILAIASAHLFYTSANEREARRLMRTWRWDLAKQRHAGASR
jgi:hypothetical protein